MKALLLISLLGVLPGYGGVDGFVDARLGGRTRNDPGQDSASIREIRWQVDVKEFLGPVDLELKADLLYDDLDGRRSEVDLDRGAGWVDLRSASLAFRPADWADVKLGRQVLTWGTGDLLFINDLFPKDWQSFFNGRDVEYLKAPSDAVWLAGYFGPWTLDAVWMPRFDADRYLDGDGISFGNGLFSPDAPLSADVPSGAELALRVSRYLGSLEIAGYAYDGYWKSPGGFREDGRAQFPALRVVGASAQAPGFGGLVNAELGYYDSREDRDGDDPGVANSETRALAGYSRELMSDFTLGLQAYVEWMQDHDAYLATLPEGMRPRDAWRQVGTLRLTRQLWSQTLTLSGFLFVSPSDEDGYLRASVEYKWTDTLTTTLGGNWFYGEDPGTFFGQLENNSNLYIALRRWL